MTTADKILPQSWVYTAKISVYVYNDEPKEACARIHCYIDCTVCLLRDTPYIEY